MSLTHRRHPRGTPEARHRAQTDRAAAGGCWMWIGSGVTNSGYARFNVNGVRVSVHRWAFESYVRPLLPGEEVDHLCNVPLCSNPKHLRACSPRENTLRSEIAPAAVNARKVECLRGHPFDDTNTYVRSDGSRKCRRCRVEHQAAYRARTRRAA